MKWFYNLKIRVKMLSGFIIVALLGGIIGVFGIVNLTSMSRNEQALYSNNILGAVAINNAQQAFMSMRVAVRDLVIYADKDKTEFFNAIQESYMTVDESFNEYEKSITNENEQDSRNFSDLKSIFSKYKTEVDKIVKFSASSQNSAETLNMVVAARDMGNQTEEAILKVSDFNAVMAKGKIDEDTSASQTTINIMVGIVVLSLVIAIFLGVFIANAISKSINKLLIAANSISAGNLDFDLKIDTKDEIGNLAGSFEKIIYALHNLITDANMLEKAAIEGKLATRADASKHGGDYKKIVDGVNKTLDAVIGPLNVAADYVDKISKGNIPAKITDNYNGDFNTIKNNLNTCIDAVNALVADANMLSRAAIEGKLATRADASKHGGDFAKIVDGVNGTLDAVIKPVQEAAAVLNQMSNGNLQLRVMGDYKGEHAEIKNAMNNTLDALSSYVSDIANVLTEMANSNMTVETSGDYKGDFAQIKGALNLIIQSFNQVLSDINNASDQVAAGSRQVSDGSQALSQGATEQAGSIEQLTASITEIAAQTKQNAVSANNANELALHAKNNAADGNAQMKDMLKAMEEINTSSANISKIIKVIDEIAFQTNILALNAAVEAARAGQHGKGFAVVAEEVRNLAARSASAAKETTGLIEGSIKKVETGTKIANETAAALDRIVKGVAEAANLVGAIASASNEQATSIAQVNQGVEQVSMVVQSNSATAEESAAASEELSSQADLLKDMIGRFRLKKEEDQSGKGHLHEARTKNDNTVAKKQSSDNRSNKRENSPRKNPRVALSDAEFGKY